MAKRRTIGENPLDTIVPDRSKTEESGKPREKQTRVVKERLTVHLPVDLINRVKNAVYWTPGLTLAGLAEIALRDTVDQLEEDRGEPFPQREGELKGGRPLS